MTQLLIQINPLALLGCDGCTLLELPEHENEPQTCSSLCKKLQVLAVCAMVVRPLAFLQLSQRNIPRDFTRYAIVGEVEA
jgi:hypothetical protein